MNHSLIGFVSATVISIHTSATIRFPTLSSIPCRRIRDFAGNELRIPGISSQAGSCRRVRDWCCLEGVFISYEPAEYARVISQHRDMETYFYHFDGILNIRVVTDSSEVWAGDYGFDAWGITREDTPSGPRRPRRRSRAKLLPSRVH